MMRGEIDFSSVAGCRTFCLRRLGRFAFSSNLDVNTADGEFSFDPEHFAVFTGALASAKRW